MTRTLAASAMIPFLVVACGGARTLSAPLASTPPLPEGTLKAPATTASDGTNIASVEHMNLRAPGDYVVFRFSGKLEKHPITLTERLVSQKDDVTVIDYTVEDGTSRKTMRARMVGAGTEQKVASAALMDGDLEGPVPAAVFDAFLTSTLVPTEQNGGAQRSEHASLHVGGRTIECTRTTYSVRVGHRDATMSVLASDMFAWGDVGGEIRGADGTLLYKAELVAEGTGRADAVAQKTP